MNRKQFMEQLERLLSDITEAERQEALEYYEGYFDDAGPENEGEVIRELGNPGKLLRSSRLIFRRMAAITENILRMDIRIPEFPKKAICLINTQRSLFREKFLGTAIPEIIISAITEAEGRTARNVVIMRRRNRTSRGSSWH